jgi:hypothetical protein
LLRFSLKPASCRTSDRCADESGGEQTDMTFFLQMSTSDYH